MDLSKHLVALQSNGVFERTILFDIPSRLELLGVLDQLVQAMATQLEFDEDSTNDIATSLIEAATNAIQHGHNHDATKRVRFHFVLRDDSFEAWVEDHGPGFDEEDVLAADPTGPEGLLRSRGRGIFIMKAMMDTVDFDIRPGQGVTVRLVKRLPPVAEQSAGAAGESS